MSKRVTAQEGKIELIVADTTSDIDVGNDAGYTGNVNVGTNLNVDAATGAVTIQTHESLAYAASTPGGTPVTDPNLGSVVFLATAENNTVNATTFAPEIGPTFSAVTNGAGVAEITNSAAKFGTKAIYVEDYTGVNAAYFQADAADANLTFGANDFTIEMHVYIPSIVAFSGTQDFMGIYDAGDLAWGMSIVFQTSGDFRHTLFMSSDGTTSNFISPQKLWSAGAAGTWYHLAVCRDGNNLRHFLDGTQVGVTDDVTGFTMFTPTTAVMYIGDISSDPTTGGPAQTILWDNIRITSGVARYTTNFTAPTAPYDGSATEEVLKVGDTTHARVEIADGVGLRVSDSGGTDNVVFSHDGTDFNVTGTNTTDLNFVGFSSINLGGTNSKILADITTATPPTNEAVTAQLQYWDADETDQLGAVGYFGGTGNLALRNFMQGGPISLESEDTGGTLKNLFVGDPDAVTSVYGDTNVEIRVNDGALGAQFFGGAGGNLLYNGADKVQWGTQGIDILSDANTDDQVNIVRFSRLDGTDRAFVGFSSTTDFYVLNQITNGNIIISPNGTGEIQLGSGAQQTILPLDNDAVTPTLAFGDGDTGFYETADDQLRISILGTETWQIDGSFLGSSQTGGPFLVRQVASSTNPVHAFKGDDDTGLGAAAADQLSLIAGGVEMMRLVETGTATTDQVIIAPAGIIGDNTTPALAFGDGDTGFYESSDDILYVTVGGANNFRFQTNTFIGSSSGAAYIQASAGAVGAPTYAINADTDTGMYSPAADAIALTAGGVEGIRFTEASSSVIQTHEANTGLTADVGSAQGNGVITSTYNVYSTVGTAGDAATLPATFAEGTVIYVKNDGANSMDVFPASGDDAGAGLNTAVAVPAGGSATFIATTADSTWTNLISTAGAGGTLPAGTTDNAIIKWDTTGSEWLEETALVIDDNGLVTLTLGSTTGYGLTVDLGAGNTTDGILIRGGGNNNYHGLVFADDGDVVNWEFQNDHPNTELNINAPNSYGDYIIQLQEAGQVNFMGQYGNGVASFVDGGGAGIPKSFRIFAGATMFMQENANALADTAAYGQIWVQTDTPNRLMFTDDTGQDIRISPYRATVQTTDATQTEIIAIAVASGTTFGYRINVVGNEAATGDTVFESIFGAIHNQGGTTAIVGSDIVDRTEDTGAAAWVITVAADDTTDALTVDVTGEASHTIDWKVSVEILDV